MYWLDAVRMTPYFGFYFYLIKRK